MDLPKYDKYNSCSKCGCTEVRTQYCGEKRGTPLRICWHKVDDEHIHRTCERCGYEWLEDTL